MALLLLKSILHYCAMKPLYILCMQIKTKWLTIKPIYVFFDGLLFTLLVLETLLILKFKDMLSATSSK